MGLWAKLFGNDKVIEGMYNGVDKAFFTDEEKEDSTYRRANVRLAFMKLYEPFKIAQRILAIITTAVFLGLHLILILSWLYLVLFRVEEMSGEMYEFMVSQLKLMMLENNETLGVGWLIIIGFYFGGGFVEGWVNKHFEGRKKVETAKK